MPSFRLARRPAQTASNRASAMSPLGLALASAGCTGTAELPSSPTLLLAALLLLVLLAALIGFGLATVRQQGRLRQARQAQRLAEQLQSAWTWKTDASHRLVQWAAPGQPALPRCALFDAPASDSLQQRLQAQMPFDGLQLQTEAPVNQHHGWRLRGLPQWDDEGAFAGFVGSAMPTEVEERDRVARLAPPALTLAAPGADMPAKAADDSFSLLLAHDLRSPVRVIEGFTRILKEDYAHQLDRVGNDHLERVLGAAARMNLMIDAMLALARLSQQPLARQRVNLSQLAGFIVDDLRRGSPERQVEVDIEPQISAWGDPTLLRVVLENLLGNAWKYTGRAPAAQITLRQLTLQGRPAYVVQDNGAGFDMRSAERLFSLFQRMHSASDFPGHGVGLASVRTIVRRHGGEVWAEAQPGSGAAFYFTLAD